MKKRISLFLVSFLLGSSFAWSLALSDIRTQVRRNIRDTDSSNYRYADTVINDLINEGQKEVVNLTWPIQQTTSYILTAGASYYNLPSDFLGINVVLFRGANAGTISLEEKQIRSLYQQNADWDRFFSSPAQYWVSYTTTSAPGTVSTFRISYLPIPTNTSTGTVNIWYYSEAKDLSADSDVPFNGLRSLYTYHPSLVYYVTMRIMQIDGIEDEAKIYADLFQGFIAFIKSRLGLSPNYNPGFGAGGTGK